MLANRIARPRNRHGFTLVEMLVAIGILLILMVITIAAVNVTMSEDAVKYGANQMRAKLAGSKDRAVFYGRSAGIRLQVDPNDPMICTSIIQLLDIEPHSAGTIMATDDANGDGVPEADGVSYVIGSGTNWMTLKRRGLIADGQKMLIDGNFYAFTVETLTPTREVLHLTKPFNGAAGVPLPEYSMLLKPVPMPNSDPIDLPRGVVIDLQNSVLPLDWPIYNASGNIIGFSDEMDIMFSPRGTVRTGWTSGGVVHLLLTDFEDYLAGKAVGDLSKQGGEVVVTVQTQTGRVFSTPTDLRDYNGNGVADDPFNFAETGEGRTL